MTRSHLFWAIQALQIVFVLSASPAGDLAEKLLQHEAPAVSPSSSSSNTGHSVLASVGSKLKGLVTPASKMEKPRAGYHWVNVDRVALELSAQDRHVPHLRFGGEEYYRGSLVPHIKDGEKARLDQLLAQPGGASRHELHSFYRDVAKARFNEHEPERTRLVSKIRAHQGSVDDYGNLAAHHEQAWLALHSLNQHEAALGKLSSVKAFGSKPSGSR